MIDKRLIDYSQDYKEYKSALKEKGKQFSLEDLMTLVDGFLQHKMHINKSVDVMDNRDTAVLASLEEVYSKYSIL